jgi:DNA repair protein RadC
MKNKTTNRIHRNDATKSAPIQYKIPAEFKVVRLRECPVDNPQIETPPQVVDFWRKHVATASWFKEDRECLCVFLLNVRRCLIGFELVSQGTLDTLLMRGCEVLRVATICNASAIIISHNHPSGDPSPSEADIKVTRELLRAGQYLNISLLDSIIIGDARREKSFSSLLALGYFYS